MKEEETPVVSTYNKDDKHFGVAFLNLHATILIFE